MIDCIVEGVCCGLGAAQARYWGRELGSLSQLHHGVRGRLFAVDARTIYLQDFHYDGEGPGMYTLPSRICLFSDIPGLPEFTGK